jgi:hypothetical protein
MAEADVTVLQHATTDLVAVAWLGSLPGFSSAMVGAILPRPDSDGMVPWTQTGFVQATTVGGGGDMYVPLASPAIQVDCWATQSNSDLPPYAKANALAETIRWACLANTGTQTALTLRAGYAQARVKSAYLLTEPRRVYGDEADYARYLVNVLLNWTEVTAP